MFIVYKKMNSAPIKPASSPLGWLVTTLLSLVVVLFNQKGLPVEQE